MTRVLVELLKNLSRLQQLPESFLFSRRQAAKIGSQPYRLGLLENRAALLDRPIACGKRRLLRACRCCDERKHEQSFLHGSERITAFRDFANSRFRELTICHS